MDNFRRVSDIVRRRLGSRSSAFQTFSKRGLFLIRTRLASRSSAFSAFGFSFERVWLLVLTRFIQLSNGSRLWTERVHTRSERVHTRSERVWTKNVLYLVPHGDCIWCSSFDRFDNFELLIDRQHYFWNSSFKRLRHSSHFAKILFNRQRDYCAWAIKPRLRSYNRGFI